MKNLILVGFVMLSFSSCVPKRMLVSSQNHVDQLQSDSTSLQNKVYNLENQISSLKNNILDLTNSSKNQKSTLESNIADLNKKITDLTSQNQLLGQQTTQQQSLLNQNKEELAKKQQRLQQLEDLLAQQRAASEQLKNKMTEALKGYNSNDLTVSEKNGKVYVSLSENLLFPSGSAEVNPKGVDALSKLAAVLNLNPDVNIQIEGNTDSIPISGKYQDNWALSTARANSIVRILVNKYNVDPHKVVSVGQSYYDPVDTNSTPEGRAKNRRTDIVVSPDLEQLMNLLNQNS